MSSQDYDGLRPDKISTIYYRDKIVAAIPSQADNTALFYGDVAETEYKRLVNAGTIVEGGTGSGNLVSSVAGRTGAVVLTKADVGLTSVDDTADTAKPISTATQDALNGKAASSHTHTLSQVSDASALGRQIASTADAASARGLIGAGTSNLSLGTSGSTAKAGDYTPGLAELPAGTEFHRYWTGTAWEARGTARTDLVCVYTAARSVTDVPTDKVNGKDIREFSGD